MPRNRRDAKSAEKDPSQPLENLSLYRGCVEGRYPRSFLCNAIVEVVRKLRGFFVQTQPTDKIMAGQNHTGLPFKVLPATIPSLLHMILSCHDSVFVHLVAALPRCALCVSALILRRRLCVNRMEKACLEAWRVRQSSHMAAIPRFSVIARLTRHCFSLETP